MVQHSYRVVAIILLLVLTASAFVILIAVPSRADSASPSTLLHDDFTRDTNLNQSLWQVNGPVGSVLGLDDAGFTLIPLSPSFSSAGMKVAQANQSEVVGTIQSVNSFSPPFTATAVVEGTVSNGHTFGFAIASTNASNGVLVYGNLNPTNCSQEGNCGDPTTCGTPANSAVPQNQCYYGIDAKTGKGGGSWPHAAKLYLTPSVNIFYTLQISVDASGSAQYSVSQGGQVLGQSTAQVGTGPFYIIMEQGEGAPVATPGPNQAYWTSVSLTPTTTTFSTTSSYSTASSFSTASTAPGPTTSGISTIDLLIIVVVVVILFLIILLWYRRRNLTIRVQDAGTHSPVIEAVVSADGPEKLRGYADKDGKITFKGVKKGDYTIQAEAKGYIPSTPVKIEVKKTTEYTVKLDRTVSGVQEAVGGNAPPEAPSREVVGPREDKPSPQDAGATAQNPNLQPRQPQTGVAQPIQQGSAPAVTQPEPAPSPTDEQGLGEMEGFGGGRIGEIIKTFQMKGAVSPETALTAQELGLSRLFVRIMKRRKGRTRIFVEINGRYYLNQKALREMNQ